ncbi:uncharacterized protein LOC112089257 [Eutrema salsugineum]|uniref:uncharacterized protein LOC112089257 n=1 Tax=Eutrema salsugineum TaxID=72664 RepID=UPI000CED0B76|nr:uncharacterized protein LOC112089257 [Eutrema salsugineum]
MADHRSSSTSVNKDQTSVLCYCNETAKIVKAWTDANTARRFYTCRGRRIGNGFGTCKIFCWFDVEKPYGWQHLTLLEARDIIREQKEEIRNLKQELLFRNAVNVEKPSDVLNQLKQFQEECEALKQEVLVLKEKSTVQYLMSLA